MGDVVPLRDVFGRLTRTAPPPAPGTSGALIIEIDAAERAQAAALREELQEPADEVLHLEVLPQPPGRALQLEATLMLVQADLQKIERALGLEPTSRPLDPPSAEAVGEVADALYRAMNRIRKVTDR